MENKIEDLSKLKREVDSMDDFEHLGHDSSPLKEMKEYTSDFLGLKSDVAAPARESSDEINSRGGNTGSCIIGSVDTSRNVPLIPEKMESNVTEGVDHFPDRKEADAKLDKFLHEMNQPPHQIPALQDKYNIQSFVDNERGLAPEKAPIHSSNDILDRYSDSEPDEEGHVESSKYGDSPKKSHSETFRSTENLQGETFKDLEDFLELPKQDKPASKPSAPVLESSSLVKESLQEKGTEHIERISEPARQKTPEPVEEKTQEPVRQKTPEPVKPKTPELVREKTPEPTKSVEPTKKLVEPELPKKSEDKSSKKPKIEPADAEAIFCKMGLDAWFNPEKLDPKVESLIYWRDPKKSGPVFGGVLLVLLSLTYFSLISVVAYLSLLALSLTIAFRIYKNVVQAVQKTGDGHPFKDFLEMDMSLPQDKVKEISEVIVAHVNAAVVELRRLFLVEDLVDSIKFGVLLWTLTYLGAWFNGMTLIIIAWVALFSLPKVYETNKTQIDANLEIVRTKLAEITTKIKAAIPMGKKSEEKKEQ
ncbi:reticulon isoform X1 [Leptinotarsa decemlineata]|uniref:reticulon isoform X1 n=1 Tax=Leptinotarsa decemlineata TaxID=7539 RepID=UPI003D30962F